MATTYRRSKVEKFKKTLEMNLDMMEKNLNSLKAEGISDGYKSLLVKYNMIYDIVVDYCMEFDLEPPVYPTERVLYGFNETENKMRRDIMEKINQLAKRDVFLEVGNIKLAEFTPVLTAIDVDEFFLHNNLNPTLSYSQAVYRACRQATMYILYAISHKLKMGKFMLSKLKIVDGFVGKTPHTWLQLDDTYYVDMTLAQFTTMDIPKIAILPIKEARDIYQVNQVLLWSDWVEIESINL
jgi:hypothetical protein